VILERKNRKEKERKEKKGKKEKKEKEDEKRFPFGAIPLLVICLCYSSVTSFVSRLTSLVCSSLGPAQYRH
jgi:hypothetical protein